MRARKTYEFPKLFLGVLERTEITVDALQFLLKLLVEGADLALTFLLQELLPKL